MSLDTNKTYLVWNGAKFPNSTLATFKAPTGSTIDWGDSTVETFDTESTTVNTHTYLDGKTEHTIAISGLTSIDNSAFLSCSSLISVTISNSVTSINEKAFRYCSSLTSIAIPNSVTSIGDNAFSACSSLMSIAIPDSVTSIGDYAFSSCSNLTSVMIPDLVTSIGSYAFNACTNLTSVMIPDSVTSIGDYAFYSCSNLTSVMIPDLVTSIGSYAFSACSSLTQLILFPSTPPTLGSNVIPSNVQSIYVQQSFKAAYQAAANWAAFASKIVSDNKYLSFVRFNQKNKKYISEQVDESSTKIDVLRGDLSKLHSELKGDLADVEEELIFSKSINQINPKTGGERGVWCYNGQWYGFNQGNTNTKNSRAYTFEVTPNTKYRASLYKIETGMNTSKPCIYFNFFDVNREFISGGINQFAIVAPANAKTVTVQCEVFASIDDTEESYVPLAISCPNDEQLPSKYVPFNIYVKEEVIRLGDEVEQLKNGGTTTKKYWNVPSYYELVVGDTFELFWKGVLCVNNPYNYNIKVNCDMGNMYQRKYMCTPNTSQVGTHTLSLSLYDDKEVLLDTATINLIVKDKVGSPSAQTNVLCVGDSLLVSGLWAKESNRRLTGNGGTPVADGLSNINYIGTCERDNVKYEGYGGWTFDTYNNQSTTNRIMWITCTHDKTDVDQHSVYTDTNGTQWKLETIESNRIKVIRTSGTNAIPTNGTLTWVSGGENHTNIAYTSATQASGNPFWNESTNKVDFANYATNLGVSSIDYLYVLLGWNSTNLTNETYKTQIQTFISNVHYSFPNCKITLMGLQVPSIDGLGENYGCAWNYYEKLQKVFEFNDLYKSIADSTDNVYFVNIAGQFDTENNMLEGNYVVNTRNSKTEIRQNNGVHPDIEGYLQIADAVYRSIVHRLQD